MATAALAEEPQRPLWRSEYDRLVDAGAFTDERLELLDGRLVLMSPQGSPHAYAVQVLTDLMVRGLGDRAYVRIQLPFALSDLSEPEPDLAVVPRVADPAHPSTAWLVVEVAESSLRRDRDVKAALYAQGDVAEYWIVDVTAGTVLVHRDPRDGRWAHTATVPRTGTVSPQRFPDLELAVADFLPAP